MKRCNLIGIAGAFLITGLFVLPAFSQSDTTTTTAVSEDAPQTKELAIYGEVQDVNAASGSISVQYYDYDTDEEKSATILTDKDTKMENAAALNDIKQGDWVDVTYAVSDGKNVAKFIMVEKEEELADTQATGTAPAELPEEE